MVVLGVQWVFEIFESELLPIQLTEVRRDRQEWHIQCMHGLMALLNHGVPRLIKVLPRGLSQQTPD